MKIDVFDPPMCCSTGVCGAEVDPVLPRFAADLEWLKQQGIGVTRYNMAQQPAAFVEHAIVQKALKERGNDCMPMILMDDKVISSGEYPDRESLAAMIPGVDAAKIEPSNGGAEAPCCGGTGCC